MGIYWRAVTPTVNDEGKTDSWFLSVGDSGYPLEPWLMTPLATTTTMQEVAFNAAHCKTRNVVERCFGVWKSRFRCLDKTGGTLLYGAEKTCQLVVATAVLHNIAISRRLASVEDPAVLARSAAIQPASISHAAQSPALTVTQLRQTVVQQF